MRNITMKTFVLATVAALTLAGTAHAGAGAKPLSFSGYGEYAVEAQAFELGAGANYTIDALDFGATAVFVKENGVDLGFDHVDLTAAYVVTTGTELYGKVALDSDLEYDETTVGIAFSF